jgi:hypothetical protein
MTYTLNDYDDDDDDDEHSLKTASTQVSFNHDV